jgi:hypothetical protein
MGSGAFPLSEIPFQDIVDRVASGAYKAKPAKVFRFEEIQAGHRLRPMRQAARSWSGSKVRSESGEGRRTKKAVHLRRSKKNVFSRKRSQWRIRTLLAGLSLASIPPRRFE